MTDSTCLHPNCIKPPKVRGRCRTHYMQWYRSPEGQAEPKVMGRPPESPKPCIAEACSRAAVAHALCLMHYKRWRRTDETLGLTVMQQFFLHVTEDDDGCWIWDKPGSHGYGQFGEDGQNHLSHRWIYERMVAEIPESLTIDHLCRRPRCVNPYHMDPVPSAVNNARSGSVSALNARKTHCLRGHAFDEANTYLTPNGGRRCRACMVIRANAH